MLPARGREGQRLREDTMGRKLNNLFANLFGSKSQAARRHQGDRSFSLVRAEVDVRSGAPRLPIA